MPQATMRHPIFDELKSENLSLKWLASKIDYSHDHVRAVAANLRDASPHFRARCAEVMGRPESKLFHTLDTIHSLPKASEATADSHGVLTTMGGG